MECLFGITGSNFTLLAADTRIIRSIVVIKSEAVKFRSIGPCTMVFSGEPGDAANFADYVECNLQLYKLRNERELDAAGAAGFVRKSLADALRSKSPYNVNMLIGGNGELYWMDYLASLVKVPFGAHGYGAYFCLGLMDKLWHEGMSEEEAVELLKRCLGELKERFVVNLPVFQVRIVRTDGSVESRVLEV